VTARIRKLIGSLAIMAFLALYIWVVASMSLFVPDHWAAELAYYAVTGLAWGLPILPLISWMNRGR
jgi:hypothetical protein